MDWLEGQSKLLPRPPGPTPLLPSLALPLAHQGGGPTPARPEGGWVGGINFPPPRPRSRVESPLKMKKNIITTKKNKQLIQRNLMYRFFLDTINLN